MHCRGGTACTRGRSRSARGPRFSTRAPGSRATGWGSRAILAAAFRARDEELLGALRAGRPVVLWFEHDLYDQLQLLDVLALVRGAGVPHETLELIQVGSFPGRPGFRGLGELSADELETLWPQRVPVAASLLADASSVWDDVRATTRARSAGGSSPWSTGCRSSRRRSGASSKSCPRFATASRERSVSCCRCSPTARSAAQHAFVATQELEDAPFHGDSWVFRALSELGRGDTRLVETAAGEPVPSIGGNSSEVGAVDLVPTALGRRVLDGEDDRVALLGIDRWVGGTHLTPAAVWRWDGASRALVAPA